VPAAEAAPAAETEAVPAAEATPEAEEIEVTEAEGALTKLTSDDQVDLSYVITDYSLADLRASTNTINNLMDEATAAGTQRLQRLMIHNKYLYEDEIPFPVSKKGVVQKRGPARLKRIEESLKKYISYSKELLEFL